MTAQDDAWRVARVRDPAEVTRVLSDAGHYLSELSPIGADLESIFLALTAESDGTALAADTPVRRTGSHHPRRQS